MKALVFCSDGIDITSGYLTGGGIRSLQICNYLISNKFEVIKSVPMHANSIGNADCTYESSPEFLMEIIRQYSPQLVVFCNAQTFTLGRAFKEFKIWIDIHGPIFYESSLISNTDFEKNIHNFIGSLKHVDIITSVSITQKLALNFFTVGSTINNIFVDKISVLPIFISNNRISHKINNKLNIGYSGSIYPWIEPIEFIKAFARHENLSISLFSNHHNLSNANRVNKDFFDLFLKYQNIKFYSLIPFLDLVDKFCEIDFIFDLSLISGERQTAVNTRVLDFISMSIPVVINSYAYMAKYYQNELSNLLVNDIEDVNRVVNYMINLDDGEYQELKKLSLEAYDLYQNELTFSIHNFFPT
jgi:hypothetical protein